MYLYYVRSKKAPLVTMWLSIMFNTKYSRVIVHNHRTPAKSFHRSGDKDVDAVRLLTTVVFDAVSNLNVQKMVEYYFGFATTVDAKEKTVGSLLVPNVSKIRLGHLGPNAKVLNVQKQNVQVQNV